MYKKYYKRFLEANIGIQNYESQSHHCWPDVAHEALVNRKDDSSNKLSETQKLIANFLNISAPERILFSPSTYDFIYKLLGSFDLANKIKILTTDSEAYGFDLKSYQINTIEKVQVSPFDNFEDRFIDKIKNNSYDVIFFSHVFFNSGMAIKNLKAIVDAVKDNHTMIVIDGRHGFMALPTDLSNIESRVFYLGGVEDCCFIHIPNNFKPSFAFITIDPSALYRINAILNLFQSDNITVEKIHAHIQYLQNNFREHLLTIDHHYLTEKNILNVDYNYHGHFLTFAMPSPVHAKKLHDELRIHKIITDYTESKLRFGFGLYQNDVIDLSAMKMKKTK